MHLCFLFESQNKQRLFTLYKDFMSSQGTVISFQRYLFYICGGSDTSVFSFYTVYKLFLIHVCAFVGTTVLYIYIYTSQYSNNRMSLLWLFVIICAHSRLASLCTMRPIVMSFWSKHIGIEESSDFVNAVCYVTNNRIFRGSFLTLLLLITFSWEWQCLYGRCDVRSVKGVNGVFLFSDEV